MGRFLILSALAVCAAVNTGCGLCCGGAKPGFSISYQLPPTINSQAIVGPQVTSYAAQGLACGPTAGQLGLYSADAYPAPVQAIQRLPVVASAPAPVQLRTTTDCASAAADVYTPQEIYRLVERLSRQVEAMHALQRQFQQQRTPKPAPMPMPKECDGDASDD